MIREITSTQNAKYKYIKSLKTKKGREKEGQYTVEGIKSVKDAIAAGASIDCLVISDKFSCDIEFENIYKVPEELFDKLSSTDTPPGILAVINMQNASFDIRNEDLILYCDRISDPGNMGTIIRICDAVDCALVLSGETVDIYNPKTVRSSMGSFFRTRLLKDKDADFLKELKKDGFTIISGALGKNTRDYKGAPYKNKTVIVVGNEANGISDEILALSDTCVKIPIWGGAESLNVGVAAALLLYEAKNSI